MSYPFPLYAGLLLSSLLCLSQNSTAHGATFHVAPDGDDRNPGTAERPWATLAGARDGVRASGLLGRQPVEVIFRAGVYYLPETAVFTAEDSGGLTAPVIYRTALDQEVAFSGAQKLALDWQPGPAGIWTAVVPPASAIDQLFVNGQPQRMARYPNYDPNIPVYNGYAADAFSPSRASRWAQPAGAYIHAMHSQLWGGYHYRVTGKDADNAVRYEGGWQNNRQMGMHERYRFVENVREELDAPGEWFHDQATRLLYFMPPAGLDLKKAAIEVVRLRSLIELRGTADRPVRFLSFSGFTFRHTERTFMETKEPLLRSDWRIYRGGAIVFEGAEDCLVDHCTFDGVGGNAVFVSNYNRRVAITRSLIHDAGATGVAFVGSPAAVRNPLFEYKETLNFADLDLTPGPLSEDYPADCLVEDCLVTRVGRVEKQAAGVQIAMARRITVRHCSIYEVPRAGINIGDGTWGGHLIEGCDVFDTVLETGDHGSFNSWGRDRFWHLRDKPKLPLAELALLDAAEPTVIRDSRWRCDHGWDIDLDDGSSNYQIYNNLMLSGGLKLREGFRRHAWNNIIVNNSLHLHVWYPSSGDTFARNIVMGRYRPIQMPDDAWGAGLDFNFFTTNPADRDAYLAHGTDAHSAAGEPRFIDAVQGDFRVAPESPALAVGFRNFAMDNFGVREPRLRKLARSPVIPRLNQSALATDAPVYTWLGAELRELQGAEYSAYGISSDAGGLLLLNAPGHAEAAHLGLRTGDVIYVVNAMPVKSIADLAKALDSIAVGANMQFVVRRDQADALVTLPRPARGPQRAAPRRTSRRRRATFPLAA